MAAPAAGAGAGLPLGARGIPDPGAGAGARRIADHHLALRAHTAIEVLEVTAVGAEAEVLGEDGAAAGRKDFKELTI
jgi:hypothetical protein